MALSYRDVARQRLHAARRLSELDSRIQAFGICRNGDGFGFRAVRKRQRAFLLSRHNSLDSFEGIPISYVDAPEDARLLASVTGPNLSFGAAVQNQSVANLGRGCVGSLGCFVTLSDRSPALLSCNHVIAGKYANPGDSIAQPPNQVATLLPFSQLLTTPSGATQSTRINRIDAAVAKLNSGVTYSHSFGVLSKKTIIAKSAAQLNDGDFVFKVGYATGYTEGKISGLDMLVEDVPYEAEACWFDESIEIEGVNGPFAQPGDSGAAVLNAAGEILGLLYATNGMQYWVCPIDFVLNDLSCSLT